MLSRQKVSRVRISDGTTPLRKTFTAQNQTSADWIEHH
jgi:hypothetical protein